MLHKKVSKCEKPTEYYIQLILCSVANKMRRLFFSQQHTVLMRFIWMSYTIETVEPNMVNEMSKFPKEKVSNFSFSPFLYYTKNLNSFTLISIWHTKNDSAIFFTSRIVLSVQQYLCGGSKNWVKKINGMTFFLVSRNAAREHKQCSSYIMSSIQWQMCIKKRHESKAKWTKKRQPKTTLSHTAFKKNLTQFRLNFFLSRKK